MRDLFHKIQQVIIKEADAAVAATFQTDSVQMGDFNALNLALNIGTVTFDGSNYIMLKVQESVDDSVWTDVTDSLLVIGATAIDSSGEWLAAALSINAVSYVGSAEYVRLVGTVTGTVSAPISGHAVKGEIK